VNVGGDGDVVAPVHRDVVGDVRGVWPMSATRSCLPFSQRSMSTTAWVMTNFGMPAPLWEARLDSLMAGTPPV
jgi:hypothetical protein